jgi:hypothetical protein
MVFTIYVCNLCFVAAGKEKGIVVQGPLLEKIDKLETECFELRVKADGLDQGLTGLIRAHFFDPDTPAVRDVLALLEDPPVDPGGQQGATEGIPAAGGHVDGSDGAASEPSDEPDLGAIRDGFQLDGGFPA